jgi:hypothetical protein
MDRSKKPVRKKLIDTIQIGESVTIFVRDPDAQRAISADVDGNVLESSFRCVYGEAPDFPYDQYGENRNDYSNCPGFADVDLNSFANRLFDQLTGVRLPAILCGDRGWRQESAVRSVIDCKLVETYRGAEFVLRGYDLYSDGRFCKNSVSEIWGRDFLLDRWRQLDGSWVNIPMLAFPEDGEARRLYWHWMPGGKVTDGRFGDKVFCEVRL